MEGLLFYLALGSIITLGINYALAASDRMQAIIIPALLFFSSVASLLFGWLSDYYLAGLFVVLGGMLAALFAINLVFSIWWIVRRSD